MKTDQTAHGSQLGIRVEPSVAVEFSPNRCYHFFQIPAGHRGDGNQAMTAAQSMLRA